MKQIGDRLEQERSREEEEVKKGGGTTGLGKNREKGWRGVGWKGGTEGPIISKLKTRVDAHVMGNQYLKTLCRYHMAIHNSAMVGIKPESTSDSLTEDTTAHRSTLMFAFYAHT